MSKMPYNYCSRCAASLVSKSEFSFVCPRCNFHLYVNPAPTVTAVLTDSENNILFVRRAVPPHKDFWDLPGGFIETHESAEEAVVREINEELGVNISNSKYFGSYVDFYNDPDSPQYTLNLVFICRTNSSDFSPADDVSEWRFIDPAKTTSFQLAFDWLRRFLHDYKKRII